MKDIIFKFYVLNYNHNKKKIENFNIFNNILVNEGALKAVRKYLRSPKNFKVASRANYNEYIYGFEAFVEELRRLILWQEWGRCEYEIVVKPFISSADDKEEKWDCYAQALPNIEMIAREVIYQYKEYLKESKKESEVE